MSPAQAFLALVQANAKGRTVFDSIVMGSTATLPLQYFAVYPDPGQVTTGEAVDGYRDGRFAIRLTTVAAASPNIGRECRDLAAMMRDALVGTVLDAPGWVCGPIEHDYAGTAQKDESVVERPTVFIADSYAFLADRLT